MGEAVAAMTPAYLARLDVQPFVYEPEPADAIRHFEPLVVIRNPRERTSRAVTEPKAHIESSDLEDRVLTDAEAAQMRAQLEKMARLTRPLRNVTTGPRLTIPDAAAVLRCTVRHLLSLIAKRQLIESWVVRG